MENEVLTAQEKEEVRAGLKTSVSSTPEQIEGEYLVTLRVNETVQYFKLPKEIRNERKKRIGSTWVKGTKDILRGLTEEEEKRYLPKIIGISPTSESWDMKVREYWANMTLDVPPNGITFNIGVNKGYYLGVNKEGTRVEKEGLIPINLSDYIGYNFCRKHKWVAVSKEDLDNVDFFPFFIENHRNIKLKGQEAFILRKKAGIVFNKLISSDKNGSIDEDKIDWILEVSKRNVKSSFYNKNHKSMTIVEKEMALENEKNVNPDTFIRIVTDKDLEEKSFISNLIETHILERSGNTYIDENDIIASSTKELVVWLKNPINSKRRITYEERLKAIRV